jgi:hypothetical protein
LLEHHDDNLLACPRDRVEAVFEMLRRRGCSTCGSPAATDPGDAFDTLRSAARRLHEARFPRGSHLLRCYILIGYPKDTFDAAEKRLQDMMSIGFTPMAMLCGGRNAFAGNAPDGHWRAFQRRWARPAIIHARQVPPTPKRVLWVRKALDALRRLERHHGYFSDGYPRPCSFP